MTYHGTVSKHELNKCIELPEWSRDGPRSGRTESICRSHYRIPYEVNTMYSGGGIFLYASPQTFYQGKKIIK